MRLPLGVTPYPVSGPLIHSTTLPSWLVNPDTAPPGTFSDPRAVWKITKKVSKQIARAIEEFDKLYVP